MPRITSLSYQTVALASVALLTATLPPGLVAAPPPTTIRLPKDWQDRFWNSPQAQALLKLPIKDLADLVPVQAGLKFCSCPACDADERTDPLAWSIENPKTVQCRKCQGTFPNDAFPAPNPADRKIPVEKVEVQPGVWHEYPYHPVALEKAGYPDERLYLAAKRDYETRAWLAKAALYAALRWDEQDPAQRDPALERIATVLLLRFSQVYPAYAMHTDQPGSGKQLMPAKVAPPYRHGFQTGKWEWNGSLETPMNLVLAYGLVRDHADWSEAGELLGCTDPRRAIENDLFLAAAELSSRQPDDFTEESLTVYRGMLGVGRLLGSEVLIQEARSRIAEFTRRGFYYDGFWRGADVLSHRRVLRMLDGWLDGLTTDPADAQADRSPRSVIELARSAAAAVPSRPPDADVQLASWPIETSYSVSHRPMMLGGAGLSLLSIGDPTRSLDVEVRGRDGLSDRRSQRLAFRLVFAGVPLLDDLDERPATSDGFDLATASHNTVMVDGLNQRETPRAARAPVPGSDFLFFAADPDFQVVTAVDRHAYPISTRLYRQTFLVSRWGGRCYAVSIFEIDGGMQHDQLFHSPAGRKMTWKPVGPANPAAGSLLPPSIAFLPSSKPEEGRWFVQSLGEFHPRLQADVAGPCQVILGPQEPDSENGPSLRLHILGDAPSTLITADSTDAPAVPLAPPDPTAMRASLIVRRRSSTGGSVNSRFVTLFEPITPDTAPLVRVGRVATTDDAVVLLVESPEGSEHLIFNRKAGTAIRVQLASGRTIATDGLAVRIRDDHVSLAGGTFVEAAGRLIAQTSVKGVISDARPEPSERGRGWFFSPSKIAVDPTLIGRSLFIEHADGSAQSWTLASVEPTPDGTRFWVREEPGFRIEPATGAALGYQFPMASHPGPHRFRVARMAHSGPEAAAVGEMSTQRPGPSN